MNNEIDFLYASDGTGEAVRAIVTGTRIVAATILEVDSVNNWPAKFVATVGTLNETTGIIDPATVTIFKGHLSGGDIIIDEIAPGYTDLGNSVGQVVVIKPSTFWADTWADIMLVSHNPDGTLKADSVDTDAIQNGAVTTAKIDDGAVTPDKLATGVQTATTATSQATTTQSFTNLATVGPSVTITVGNNGLVLVSLYAYIVNSSSSTSRMSFEVSGANVIAASTARAIEVTGTSGMKFSGLVLLTGLTPGSTTFTAKYMAAGNTATFADRAITVIPL